MRAGKVERMGVVLKKERLEMGQRVVGAEEAHHPFLLLRRDGIELVLLQPGEFVDQRLIDDEVLLPVGTRGLILLLASARFQELGHHEIGIAEQGWDAQFNGYLLGQERSGAVADNDGRTAVETQLPDEAQGLLRMKRQVGRQHVGLAPETLPERLGRDARAGSEKTVQKQYYG